LRSTAARNASSSSVVTVAIYGSGMALSLPDDED
jgi:hypothetical protein